MSDLPSIENLVSSFARLPGIGVKTAERLAFSVLKMEEKDVEFFASSLLNVKKSIHKCPECGLFTENDKCEICGSPTRNRSSLCVVADSKDAFSIEKMKGYDGLYHILGGTISISKGVGASDLAIDSLLKRVDCHPEIREIILALSPTIDGETTSLFIAKLLSERGIEITRLGYGLPMGSSLDYADSLTLKKSFEGRRKIG